MEIGIEKFAMFIMKKEKLETAEGVETEKKSEKKQNAWKKENYNYL